MKIKNYFVKGFGYNSPPQDGKGNEVWDEVEVVLSKKEFLTLKETNETKKD